MFCPFVDAIAYTALLRAYAKGGQEDRAFELLGNMRNVELNPTVVTYGVAIAACRRTGEWERAIGKCCLNRFACNRFSILDRCKR